jgi:hypothetical protein
MGRYLDWLIHTDAGLWTRIGIGAAIFAALAVADVRRNGRSARRWREYLFLLACVVAALAYGAVNDQLTVGISWEYFYYGKGLDQVLGGKTPPEQWALRWEAAKVGLKATWSAGLILGAAMLMANNPAKDRPALTFARLAELMPRMLAITVATAVALGCMGHYGLLNWLDKYLALLWQEGQFRPVRFMTVYGIHLGGYAGGAIATVWAVIHIRRSRQRVTA